MFIKDQYKEDIERIKNDRKPTYREVNVGWPSEALANTGKFSVGSCQRELFYKSLGVPPTNEMAVRVRRICDSGNMYEDNFIKKFKDTNKHIAEQVRIEYIMPGTLNEVLLSGKIDEIIADDGKVKGIEIKTVEGFKAEKIFGTKWGESICQPLPAPNNLMQAMLYKWKAMHEEIEGHNVDEIYLAYINRGDYTTMFFKIDLDEQGYPIITPIDMSGRTYTTIETQKHPSYDQLLSNSTLATSDQSRIAELRICVHDIFKKFDESYSYIREQILPPKDFELTWNDERAYEEFHCGRISATKYNKHIGRNYKTGRPVAQESIGDRKCSYCDYRVKCLEDEGIRFKEPIAPEEPLEFR